MTDISEKAIAAEDFRLESAEGLPIRGTIVAPEAPGSIVVIAHGFKGFKEWGFFPWLTERFAERGMAAVRFDMSRNGIGDGSEEFDRLDLFADDSYSIQLSDLSRVIEYLESLPAFHNLPLFLLGHSRGGAIAILAGTAITRVRAIVTWSSISTVDRWDEVTKRRWRQDGYVDVLNSRTGQVMRMSTATLDDVERNGDALDLRAALSRTSKPVLLLHGGADESVSVNEAKDLARSGRNCSVVLIEGAGHTFGAIHPLVDVPTRLRLAFEITACFLRSHA